MTVPTVDTPPERFDFGVETLIIGAGACGLVAALAAKEIGREVLVIEADPVPAGSTALSAGLIPAAGTALQVSAGIDDNSTLFAADIQTKAQDENSQTLVDLLARNAGPAIDWLCTKYALPFTLVDDFDYPGHSRRRMHGLPTRSGAELIDALRSAVEAAGVDIICERRAETLYFADDRIHGIAARRPDDGVETIGCHHLILACNGFGGNRALVAKHMPAIKEGLWFGHDGNRGEAVIWADAIGAETAQLGAYQGHGNVAYPHGILVTWATITEGGVQVNRLGQRFWNEAQGYSEAARSVLSQPGGEAFTIFDDRIAAIARQFEDFKRAEAQGAVKRAETLEDLAQILDLPSRPFQDTINTIATGDTDSFGRSFVSPRLTPPYCGVRVTGALFHTQGGLCIDEKARVLTRGGEPIPNLFAGGGAACGVSGRSDSGYLSGNGLLSAVVLGRIAGSAGTVG